MKVPHEHFKSRVMDYALENVIPSLSDNTDKFLVGMGLGAKIHQLDGMLEEAGALTDGHVDTDVIDTAITMGFRTQPDGKFRFAHKRLKDMLIFSEHDWQNLKAYVER